MYATHTQKEEEKQRKSVKVIFFVQIEQLAKLRCTHCSIVEKLKLWLYIAKEQEW